MTPADKMRMAMHAAAVGSATGELYGAPDLGIMWQIGRRQEQLDRKLTAIIRADQDQLVPDVYPPGQIPHERLPS